MNVAPEVLARRLDEAWEGRAPVAPLSESEGLETVEDAYAVQTAWTELRVGRGEEIVGRKIGLSSRAMQEQFGVSEPDYGSLWSSRRFEAADGRAEIPFDTFIAPRLEGEVAFRLAERLEGPNVTAEAVLSATGALAVSVEVVDSRIRDWRIKLADTVADNASYGGFVTGPWSEALLRTDLASLELTVELNGERATEGRGSAVLGHPANSVAWLANKLHGFGVSLERGDVVLSGSLGRAVPVNRGDEFVLRADGQPPLIVAFG